MYDIAIIGAGPAGANLARLLGEAYKVVVMDRRDLESNHPVSSRNKCCGGLLAPDAQKMIAKLGLGVPTEVLVDPQLFAVRTIDVTNGIEKLYQRFYYNMDREKFDRWMVSLLSLGVDKRFNAVYKGYEPMKDGVTVHFTQKGRRDSLKTRVLIGADGACSGIRKSISMGRAVPDIYIAIQEWYENQVPQAYYTAIFDEEISDFYSWIIPKNQYLVLGSALKANDKTWEKYHKLKEKLAHHGFLFHHRVKKEGAFIYRPKHANQLWAGRDGIALVGEAAGAISPSSAEGISYALKSSLFLAQSLNEGIDGFLGRYEKRLTKIRLNVIAKNAKAPFMYHSGLRKWVMQSGIQSIR
ncbi:FAD-binding protein [Anoxynatronum sibiricum]|uniref:FAD-binding protein n=1 Tax=Anoxynatronum sibiricum TaxID=210623 RepID=A0ABU9VT49_9CLOT